MPDNRLQDVKKAIWHHRSIRRNLVNLQVSADKAGVQLPITDIREAEKLLKSLARVVRKRSTIPAELIARYNAAHHSWFQTQYPACYKDGHYITPLMPDTGTSNGLTRFIVQFLTWVGYRATRISVEGRVLGDGTRIKSSTRKGTADISSTIKGKSVMWEIKIRSDKPSKEQLREQQLERKSGGEYFFVKTVEEFFEYYDKLLILAPIQTTLL
jgi:hypothetical protein